LMVLSSSDSVIGLNIEKLSYGASGTILATFPRSLSRR
jgi:hypothetical protein